MTMTEWFPGRVYPVRDGVYQRNFGISQAYTNVLFCKFEGGEWFRFAYTAERAAEQTETVPNHWLEWRGLTEPAA